MLSPSAQCLSSCSPKSVICSTQRLVTTQFDDFRLPWNPNMEPWMYSIPCQTALPLIFQSFKTINRKHTQLLSNEHWFCIILFHVKCQSRLWWSDAMSSLYNILKGYIYIYIYMCYHIIYEKVIFSGSEMTVYRWCHQFPDWLNFTITTTTLTI